MAKTAKKSPAVNKHVAAAAPEPLVPPPAEPQKQVIDIAPAEGASEGQSLQLQAARLTIANTNDHRQVLEFVRGGKQLKRKIEEHWTAIKRNVDALKKNLLDLERRDLAPVEAAITVASKLALDWQDAEDTRINNENRERERIAQQKAEDDRQAELARQEAAALKAEASSPALSPREAVFVTAIVDGMNPRAAAVRARYAGDPAQVGARLLSTEKVQDAITASRTANALREQAAATAAQPLEVKVERAVAQTASVAGVSSRSTWSAEVYDATKLLRAAGVNLDSVIADALLPNQVYLNKEAVRLKGKLESVYPGVRGVEKKGLAG